MTKACCDKLLMKEVSCFCGLLRDSHACSYAEIDKSEQRGEGATGREGGRGGSVSEKVPGAKHAVGFSALVGAPSGPVQLSCQCVSRRGRMLPHPPRSSAGARLLIAMDMEVQRTLASKSRKCRRPVGGPHCVGMLSDSAVRPEGDPLRESGNSFFRWTLVEPRRAAPVRCPSCSPLPCAGPDRGSGVTAAPSQEAEQAVTGDLGPSLALSPSECEPPQSKSGLEGFFCSGPNLLMEPVAESEQ